MFAVMTWMWIGRFGEIWRDSFEFYNFATKSGGDLLEFWILFGAMAFFHESFHGLTCKHFGGNVESMGFTLMYFAPSFYCDVTQVWIYGGKWERIATAIAGIWGDLIICFFATVVWWATTAGMSVHNLAYKIMMVTGIGVSVLNLNPLIKLDGYYIFCELIGKPDFKNAFPPTFPPGRGSTCFGCLRNWTTCPDGSAHFTWRTRSFRPSTGTFCSPFSWSSVTTSCIRTRPPPGPSFPPP